MILVTKDSLSEETVFQVKADFNKMKWIVGEIRLDPDQKHSTKFFHRRPHLGSYGKLNFDMCLSKAVESLLEDEFGREDANTFRIFYDSETVYYLEIQEDIAKGLVDFDIPERES